MYICYCSKRKQLHKSPIINMRGASCLPVIDHAVTQSLVKILIPTIALNNQDSQSEYIAQSALCSCTNIYSYDYNSVYNFQF